MSEDTISRKAAIEALQEHRNLFCDNTPETFSKLSYAEKSRVDELDMAIATLINLPSAQPERKTGRWIPCSERLPENIRPVIVTWKNTDPASYYQYIVGKHFTGTACYKNGKWYWYSSTTEDMLAEYGRYDSEEFDEAIECIAWMPLPKPYRAERRTDE